MLGYHGCEGDVAERLLAGEPFRVSRNDYDWLGVGIYFWEANPCRGLEFAGELKRRGRGNIDTPAVVGAIINLGLCLDLTTTSGIREVEASFAALRDVADTFDVELPRNSENLLLRRLDCAVINILHDIRARQGLAAVDTVRGVFLKGGPIYPTSGLHVKTHIQIAVRNTECIKGVFRVAERFLT